MEDLEKLYNIYHSNIKVDQFPLNENVTSIKVGDLVVVVYNNKEIRGEVSAVFESYYLLKGKNGSTLKVTLDDVTEHYPKNRSFENKTVRKFTENLQQPEQNSQKSTDKVQQKKKRIIDEEEDHQQENTPDNQIDLTIEKSSADNIKAIGKLVYYTNMKYSEITEMFEKKLLSKEEYWYLLTEKNNEIHVIRNNDKGFEIQPFVHALVGHFMKNKNLNEGANQMKVAGNSNFSVVSNIPPNLQKPMLNSLIALLSGIKK